MKPRSALSLLLSLVAFALAAAPAQAKLVGFQTPDKTVGCYLSGQGARCDVRDQEWVAPTGSMGCELDYGFGVEVGRTGVADYVCAGDTTLDRRHPVLRKGETLKAGRFKCKHKGNDTIRCANTRSKTGFIVSRERVELFWTIRQASAGRDVGAPSSASSARPTDIATQVKIGVSRSV